MSKTLCQGVFSVTALVVVMVHQLLDRSLQRPHRWRRKDVAENPNWGLNQEVLLLSSYDLLEDRNMAWVLALEGEVRFAERQQCVDPVRHVLAHPSLVD